MRTRYIKTLAVPTNGIWSSFVASAVGVKRTTGNGSALSARTTSSSCTPTRSRPACSRSNSLVAANTWVGAPDPSVATSSPANSRVGVTRKATSSSSTAARPLASVSYVTTTVSARSSGSLPVSSLLMVWRMPDGTFSVAPTRTCSSFVVTAEELRQRDADDRDGQHQRCGPSEGLGPQPLTDLATSDQRTAGPAGRRVHFATASAEDFGQGQRARR